MQVFLTRTPVYQDFGVEARYINKILDKNGYCLR